MANLTGAFLTESILTKANLENADLAAAKLIGANLTQAKLTGTILTKAGLRGAKVKTIISASGINNTANTQFTDLSQCVGLTEAQLKTMDGDTGVILPEGWKHPAHWPEWDEGEDLQKESAVTIVEKEQSVPPTQVQASTALKNQVRFVLETASAAQDGANLASIQITAAVEKFITETGLNTSDEIEIFSRISKIFGLLANALDINQNDTAKIQELEAIIASQKVELERLTRLLENKPSALSKIMILALGTAGGVALTHVPTYFFGSEGAEIITNITNYFAINPDPIPPSLTVG